MNDSRAYIFLALEKIRRKRIDPKVENMVHTIGFVLLILLMVAVTYGDVVKIL